MHIIEVEQRSEEWLDARKGKITGSKLKDIVSTGSVPKADVIEELEKLMIPHKKTATIPALMNLLPEEVRARLEKTIPRKLGFYELLADKIAYATGKENAMERGVELEPEAIEKVAEILDEKIETVGLCVHEYIPDIAVSPDGIIRKKGKIVEAVEVKCLSTARHLQALIEKRIPDEYHFQVLQYFIVIDTLEVLHFAFYDPRLVGHEVCIIEVHRDEVKDEVTQYEEYQKKVLEEVNVLAEAFTNF